MAPTPQQAAEEAVEGVDAIYLSPYQTHRF